MLLVIVCALVLALTYPIRAYVAQRTNIRQLEAQHADAQGRVSALEAQRSQWDDPAYVEAQARARLRYVKPGEKSLVVIGQAPAPTAAPSSVSPRLAASDDPWYQRLWSTVEVAGATSTPKPAGKGTAPAPTR